MDYRGLTSPTVRMYFPPQVCDLYLELIKPVVNDNSEENKASRTVAQATLYTVLEQFLRLSHPLMPFVTEELWQRLPNISSLTSKQSIMISPYPAEVPVWTRPDIEADMAIIKETIHSARFEQNHKSFQSHAS